MAKNGAFVWYDLMTADQDAARAFYTEVIGWKTKQWDGDMPYTMWEVGDTPVGGVADLHDDAKKMGAPPHWLAYVSTADVEKATKKVTELGGTIHKDFTEIPNMGAFAVVADPQGAVFALYSSNEESSADSLEPTVGQFAWHELMADDWHKAWSFYEAMFGWAKGDAIDMGDYGTYQLFEAGGRVVGGMMTKPADLPAPPHWLYYVSVENLDQTLERVKSQGGKVLNGPMEVPGGDRVAQCIDPQGAAFAVHQKA